MSECWTYYLDTNCSRIRHAMYVGISDSPSSRMGNHESQKWWWWLVDSIQWQKHCSREDAKQCETQYIEGAGPAFNVQESTLSPWLRLSKQIDLLWTHDENSSDCTACPFCESHGFFKPMNPSSDFAVFRRHCDDQLVISWDVSCDEHSVPVKYAMHMTVETLLVKFRCPRDEAQRLVSEACMNGAPWENRMKRRQTLFDVLENSAPSRFLIAEGK